MAENIVIGDSTYSGVESISLTNDSNKSVQYYNDAVRYVEQTLTEEEKTQVRTNIDVYSKIEIDTAIASMPIPDMSAYETKEDASFKLDEAKAYADEQINAAFDGQFDLDHTHDNRYYTETEIDEKIARIDESISNMTVSGDYETKEDASAKLTEAKTYTDEQVAVAKEYAANLFDEAVVNSHNHNDLYYTEEEIDTKIAELNEAIGNSPNGSYETKEDAVLKFDEAKAYADTVGDTVKNELLNGAGEQYDTLKELGDLISENKDAFDALQEMATGKAEAIHTHNIEEVNNLQSTLDTLQSLINEKTAPAGDTLGTVMTGGNVTIKDGVITVLDDSHNHTLANIDGLQELIDTKSEIGHIHDDMYYTESEVDTKFSEINASIDNIINGATIVAETTHALNADNSVSAITSEKAVQDAGGNIIVDTYETKVDANSKLTDAKAYADGIKNDLLNGAGAAYDTLKELGDLIDDNTDAIDALNTVAAGKADVSHTHSVSEVTELQNTLSNKADVSHVHSISEVTELQGALDGKSNVGHSHEISDVNNLQNALNNKSDVGHTHAISQVTNLQNNLDAKQDKITGAPTAFIISTSTTSLPAVVDGAILLAYDA